MTTTLDTTPATDQAAVLDLLARMADTWAANDADAFAALYTSDATVTTAGSLVRGRDAIRQFMTAGFAGPLRGSSTDEHDRDVRIVGPGVAVVTDEGGIVRAGENAVHPDMQRRATWVLVHDGAQWLAASYHNCDA